MLSSLRHFEPDPVRFETQAAQLRNEYEDGVKGRGGASQLAAQHADRLLYRIAYLPAELQALVRARVRARGRVRVRVRA